MVWEAIFLLAVLKIPVIYVCCVAWWAIRAEPRPFDGLEPAAVLAPPENDPRPGTRLVAAASQAERGRATRKAAAHVQPSYGGCAD